jgi:hypothetical protein
MKPSDFLTEAAAPKVGRKYQHIEDLVLSDGSHGGLHAIERLKHMGEEGGSIELTSKVTLVCFQRMLGNT